MKLERKDVPGAGVLYLGLLAILAQLQVTAVECSSSSSSSAAAAKVKRSAHPRFIVPDQYSEDPDENLLSPVIDLFLGPKTPSQKHISLTDVATVLLEAVEKNKKMAVDQARMKEENSPPGRPRRAQVLVAPTRPPNPTLLEITKAFLRLLREDKKTQIQKAKKKEALRKAILAVEQEYPNLSGSDYETDDDYLQDGEPPASRWSRKNERQSRPQTKSSQLYYERDQNSNQIWESSVETASLSSGLTKNPMVLILKTFSPANPTAPTISSELAVNSIIPTGSTTKQNIDTPMHNDFNESIENEIDPLVRETGVGLLPEDHPEETSNSPTTSTIIDLPSDSPVHSVLTDLLSDSPVHPEVTDLPSDSPVHSVLTDLLSDSPVHPEVTDLPSDSPVHYVLTDLLSDSPVHPEVTDLPSDSPVHSVLTDLLSDSPVHPEVTDLPSDLSIQPLVADLQSDSSYYPNKILMPTIDDPKVQGLIM